MTDAAGDTDAAFTIQSISKAFVFALVCEESGHEQVHETVGVINTGRSFNSVMAVELSAGSPGNPMVNAGAMATNQRNRAIARLLESYGRITREPGDR